MAKRRNPTGEAGARAALQDATVRLVYDMFHKLAGMVEQMQDMDDGMDEEERVELHEAEDALVGRAAAWLKAKGVPEPWKADL
jgi:hypothetical protein